MKRLTFLLALAALSVGCTSRIPDGFNPLGAANAGGGLDVLDMRSENARRDALAAAERKGVVTPAQRAALATEIAATMHRV